MKTLPKPGDKIQVYQIPQLATIISISVDSAERIAIKLLWDSGETSVVYAHDFQNIWNFHMNLN